MSSRIQTGLAALAAVILPLALAACDNAEADPRTLPPLVRFEVAHGAGDSDRRFTGIVSARVQSDLGFRVPGKIVERMVDTGQAVRRGQPLMRIDRTDLALATAAQAGAVASARARAIQTAADEKRYRDLVSAGAVSASAYDQAKAAADAARAELAAAQAQAGVARNEAGYSVLLADADGVVVETLGEPGQVVSAGQPVVRLARSGPREAVISLPETLRPALGSSASAQLFNTDTGSTARLRQLSDAADPRTRTFEARYVLEGAAARAPLGSTVTIAITQPGGGAGGGAAMQVPLAALHDGGKGPGVWVIGAGDKPRVSWRPVTIARVDDENAALSSGLRSGERYVSLGAHLLHPGEAVRLAPAKVAGK